MGVPSNIIIPFVGIQFDPSRAIPGTAAMPVTAVIFGQKIASGTGAVLTHHLVSDSDQVGLLAGYGSSVHRLAMSFFLNNQTTRVYIILMEDGAGAAAIHKILFSGKATATGESDLYIDGDRYAIGVVVDATGIETAAAFVPLVNANPSCPKIATLEESVPSSGDFDTLVLTAKNKGVAAGDSDVQFNYVEGEITPAGLTMGTPVFTPGTVDPDVQDVLDTQGDKWFNIWVSVYNDSTNLDKIETHLMAQSDVLIQKMGIYYFAMRDTRANLMTFATTSSRNSQFVVMLPAYKRANSIGQVAAGVAGQTADSIIEDTAIPLHRMTIEGLLPLKSDDRWTLIERNQLAQSGVATFTDDNGVQTESTVTMYLKNSAGAADTAYQMQNYMYILMRLRYTFVNWILTRYARAKLAESAKGVDGTTQIITPDIGKAEMIAWFIAEQKAGQVEGLEQFKAEATCLIDDTNKNRLNFGIPVNLMNALIVASGDMQFII